MLLWEEGLKVLDPYVPGEQPKETDVIKLNTNENPYPPSPRVEAILKDYDITRFRKYPDPDMTVIRDALSKYHGVDASHIFVGVGSDDVLAMSFMTFFQNRKAPILFADITYSFYKVWASVFDIPYENAKLNDDFILEKEDYLKENGGIVIANPNAPTGVYTDVRDLCFIVENNPASLVIIDEAYIDFGGESMLSFTQQYDNLLVVRTFSKSRAQAGSRIGYAIGGNAIIDRLYAVRNSFNSYTMDCLTQELAVASVEDDAYFRGRVDEIKQTREEAKKRLGELGFTYKDSQANFIFAKHDRIPAKELFENLRARKIYVRYFDQPRIDNYLRITVGTKEEMETLFKALEEMTA